MSLSFPIKSCDEKSNNIDIEIKHTKNNNFKLIKLKKGNKEGYPYPICIHDPKDPIYDFRLRIIESENRSPDNFLQNYLKFNFRHRNENKLNIKNKQIDKDNFFITDNRKESLSQIKISKNNLPSEKDVLGIKEKIITKSKSELYSAYDEKEINKYKRLYINEMEKRGNYYNKIRMASLQRIALRNLVYLDNEEKLAKASIPTGKNTEFYILETQRRKKFPKMRQYGGYFKRIKVNPNNNPTYFREKDMKLKTKNLPEIIDIKNNENFKFHVFHDLYGHKKELDKKKITKLKMTKDKVRDLKIMAKIKKIKESDPDLVDIYEQVVYDGQ